MHIVDEINLKIIYRELVLQVTKVFFALIVRLGIQELVLTNVQSVLIKHQTHLDLLL